MSDTNEVVSADIDPEVAAHASVVSAFKHALKTYEEALETLNDEGKARLKYVVDTRFLGKPKGKGGRPAGSGSRADGQGTGARSRTPRA